MIKIGQNANNNTKLFNNFVFKLVQSNFALLLLFSSQVVSDSFATLWTTASQTPVFCHYLPKFAQIHAHRVSDAICLILIKYYYYVTFIELPFLHELIPCIMLNSLLSDPCNFVFLLFSCFVLMHGISFIAFSPNFVFRRSAMIMNKIPEKEVHQNLSRGYSSSLLSPTYQEAPWVSETPNSGSSWNGHALACTFAAGLTPVSRTLLLLFLINSRKTTERNS